MHLLVLAAALAAAPAAPHHFSVHDMLAMQRLSDPRVSPDGKWVAFSVRTTDVEANKGRHDLYLAAVDGSSVRRLTTHEAADTSPRWMPDGKSLVFLSTRSGSSQVWQLPLDGGEATQLTRFPLDVENLLVFPDGKRLLLTMDVFVGAKSLDETAKRLAEKEKSKVLARSYDSLLYRHWDTWEDGRRSHPFVWTLGGAEPLDLAPGLDGDAPPRPFGGTEELAISPDGKEVAFSARAFAKDSAWSTDINIYAVSSTGGPLKALTADNKATDGGPLFSPDGKHLVYWAMKRPGFEADKRALVLLDRKSGAKRFLAADWDRSADELSFSFDGATLYVSADHLGNRALFAVELASGKVRPLVEKGFNTAVSPAGSRLVFLKDTLKSPAELYSCAADGSDVRAVTRLNEERLQKVQLGEYEQFSFKGAKGDEVRGYVMKPVGYVAGRKYPVAFLIHGGPQGSFGDHFHYRWNPQAYAGAGYAAVFIDFHGSTGYGQAFTDAISGDWGGAPYEDLMKGFDAALAKYPFLDGKKACALGASYGGYMVNYLAGKTDRFACLVSHDGIFDLRFAYYDTEELWFPEWEHGGVPWEKPEEYARHNPIEQVKAWKTPMLVVHGALDYRIPDGHAFAVFSALQRRGIPSKLLHFPDENHWVLKPRNSVLWHDTVLGWLDRFLKKAPPPPARHAQGEATPHAG